MKLIENVPVTRELEEIIKRSLDNATNNVDKRPMNKQRQVRDKWQPTHGLVFKNIPDNIPRQVIYTAITQKMGQLRRENGELLFKGGLKIRNFNWPNRTLNGLRNLFPVFVSQKDRDTLYKWASCQDYHIRLDLENHRDHPEYDMESDSWDRVVQKFENENKVAHYLILSPFSNQKNSVFLTKRIFFHLPNLCFIRRTSPKHRNRRIPRPITPYHQYPPDKHRRRRNRTPKNKTG